MDVKNNKSTMGDNTRKINERRLEFLLGLSDKIHPLSDPVKIYKTITREAKNYFSAHRCYYCEISDKKVILRQDKLDKELQFIIDTYKISDFPIFETLLKKECPIIISNIFKTNLLDENLKQICFKLNILSFINIHVIKDGKLVGILCITQDRPHNWTEGEVEIALEIGQRTWLAVEKAKIEEENKLLLSKVIEEREKLNTIINSVDAEVWVSDHLGNVTLINPIAQNSLGLDMNKKSIQEAIDQIEVFELDGSPRPTSHAPLLKSLKGETIIGEEIMRHPITKELRHRSFISSPIKGENKNITGAVAIAKDITEEVRIRKELAEANNRFRIMYETSQEGILYNDLQADKLQCNQSFLDMLGYSREEIEGMETRDILFAEDYSDYERYRQASAKGIKSRGEVRLRCKDGSQLWTIYNAAPIFSNEGKHIASFAMFADITDRKIAENTLIESQRSALELAAKLKKVDKQRSQFLSTLSHELRNPAATIIMGISLMEQMGLREKQERRTMGMIKRQAKQLSRLVDDLLDITRIEQRKFKLQKKITELNNLIVNIYSDSQPMFGDKGLIFKANVIKNRVYIDGDSDRLTQVIENLLYNASKFTPRGGKVILSLDASMKTKEAIISIKDTGQGIPPNKIRKIFKTFVQVNNGLGGNIGGLGIGLSIVKEIVDRHGGRIEVISDGLGKGAEFIVGLPLVGD